MAAPNRQDQVLGWNPNWGSLVAQTANVNAAANWFAQSFIADSARTVNACRTYISALTGTLGASDITCDLYDSTGSNGAPGSSIETGKVPTATITGAGFYTFNGFTTALTALQQYWFVFKNVNGTPASNYCTFRQYRNSNQAMFGNIGRNFWGRATSTNSGSTWSLGTDGPLCLRVDYSDGYDGMPVSTIAAAGSGDGVYSTRESGVVFTTPKGCLLRVSGLTFQASKVGAPTGQPRLRLWETRSGTPTVVGTVTFPNATLSSAMPNNMLYGYFDSAAIVTVRPNTTYRITLGETTQSDTSGNRYGGTECTWDSDSNSAVLLPWGGTCQKTYFNGTSWSDTAGSLFPHGLILDRSQEFYGNADAYHQLGI